MALIMCGECDRKVSEKALSCPGCGLPMHDSEVGPDGVNLQTVQETSKILKLHGLYSFTLMVLSAPFFIILAFEPQNTIIKTISLMLFGAGLSWRLANNVRIWWHHR